MSILIPTMKMPTGCAYCPINKDSVCQAMPELGYDDGNGSERRENCPLIELVQCKDCINAVEPDKHAELNPTSLHCRAGRGEEIMNVWHKYSKYYKDYSLVFDDEYCSFGVRKDDCEND